MADDSPVKRQVQDEVETDPENGPSESKKPRLEESSAPGLSGEEVVTREEATETQDPGKKQ